MPQPFKYCNLTERDKFLYEWGVEWGAKRGFVVGCALSSLLALLIIAL